MRSKLRMRKILKGKFMIIPLKQPWYQHSYLEAEKMLETDPGH